MGFQEFDQLYKRTVFKPCLLKELTQEEKKKALESLIFIKEKRDGTFTCADEKQRGHISKEEAVSPIVLLEAVLLTCVLKAKENRDVAIIDIPNAFAQTEWQGKKVLIKLRRCMAELMVCTNPSLSLWKMEK